MFKLWRAIPVAALAILWLVWFVLHSRGSTPTPSVPNFTLSDMPVGLTQGVNTIQDDAAYAAANPGLTVEKLHGSGQVLFSEVRFSSAATAGLVVVDSKVSICTTPAKAKATYGRLASFLDMLLKPRAIPHVGVDSRGWASTDTSESVKSFSDYVAFWRGKYVVEMYIIDAGRDLDVLQFAKMYNLLDSRLQRG